MSFGIIFFGDTNPGIVPASGGGTANFLRADQTWDAPGGGSLPALADKHIYVANGANNPADYPLLKIYTVASFRATIQAVDNAGVFHIIGADSTIATNAGADIDISGGTGLTSGDGGAANINGGDGGATGKGGNTLVSAGSGGATSGDGGAVVISTGTPGSNGQGGDLIITLSQGHGGKRNGRLSIGNLPTTNAGLATGDVWVDTTGGANFLKIV